MLQYHSDNMFAEVAADGIQPETLEKYSTRTESVAREVATRIEAGDYGFIELVADESHINAVAAVLEKISWAGTLVVVGIGGSDLGARAIVQALSRPHSEMQVLFHGDSTDPNDLDVLLRDIALEETVFNIVSKSGETLETAAQFVYLKQLYQERGLDWRRHFVFTTSPGSLLEAEAGVHNIPCLIIPEDVGGRFSVLSAVGLLPALAMGIDVRQMISNARESVAAFVTDPLNSAAFELAEQQVLFFEQGARVSVMMPYSSKLNEFARWFRQLWAESLGKNGKGILPIQGFGPADQHSQLQFYVDGPFLGPVIFIRVNDHGSAHMIGQVDTPGLEYLSGRDFGEIVNAEQQASELSLLSVGRPSAVLEVDQVNAGSLGELFITLEIAAVILAELLGVNPFDQPGVQESKEFTFALLGREGYEDKLVEAEELRGE